MIFNRRPWISASLGGLAVLCGCADIHLPDLPYLAFGDSITFGLGLEDPAHQAYPMLVARAEGVEVANRAITGDQACDISPRQTLPAGTNSSLVDRTIASVLIGTNDVNSQSIGPYETVFMECHLAVLSWLAVPSEYKVLAGSSEFRTTGAGRIGTLGAFEVWETGGAGSSMSFTVSIAKGAAIYAWPVIDDASHASYTFAVDGHIVGSEDVRSTPQMATSKGTTRSLGFLRFPGLAAGKHTITFTQSNDGDEGVSVLGVGFSAGTEAGTMPRVLAGTIPYQRNTGRNGICVDHDEYCLQYIADITADVELLSSDGLKLTIFDTRKYLKPTPAEMLDSLHPSALGHQELAKAVKAVWPDV